jgi:hypothetical protein
MSISYNPTQTQQVQQILTSERLKLQLSKGSWSGFLDTDNERKICARGSLGEQSLGLVQGREEKMTGQRESSFQLSLWGALKLGWPFKDVLN